MDKQTVDSAQADSWNSSVHHSSSSISSKDMKASAFESLFDSGYSSTALSVTSSTVFQSQSSIDFESDFREKLSIGCEAEKQKWEDSGVSIDSGLSIDCNSYNQSKPKYKREYDFKKASSSNCLSIDTNNPSLLQNAYQRDEDGDTLLHLAIVQHMTDIVCALIRIVPHPDYLDISNNLLQTPLHLAALTKQSNVVRWLVVAGSTLDLQNRHGNTALHIAVENGDTASVESLLSPVTQKEIDESSLKYPSEVHTPINNSLYLRNYEGETCVHLAVRSGNEKLLKRLVLAGADVNAQEAKSGKTALHVVVENQKIHVDMAQCLLKECNADVNVVTYAGLTAMHTALNMLLANPNSNRLRVLIHLLKEFGGEPVALPLDIESCDESDDEVITAAAVSGVGFSELSNR